MDLLIFAELIAQPDRNGFEHKRIFPTSLELNFVLAPLEAGIPKKVPEEAIYFEAWGSSREPIDTEDVRRQLREFAEQMLVPAGIMPKSGPPKRMVPISLNPANRQKRWHVVLYGGSRRDCEDRKKYCLWVLTPPDPQTAGKLTTAVSSLDDALVHAQAPKGFRQSLQRMDELLEAMEQYSQERLLWLSQGCERLEFEADDTHEFRSRLSELRDKSAGLGGHPLISGADRLRRLGMDWQDFFGQFEDLKKEVPSNLLKGFLQDYLTQQAGQRLESLKSRKEFVVGANQATGALGLRFACPGTVENSAGEKVRCGQPATLRCDSFSEYDDGIFYFSHSLRSKTFKHGYSSTIPELTLVPPSPRALPEKKVRAQSRRTRD